MSTDDFSRLQSAFTATFPSDSPRADCPPAERIWEGAHDELPPAQLREVVLHVAVCPLCTEAWRLAQSLGEDPLEKTAGKARRRWATGPRHGWAQGLAAAAAVVLALGTGMFVRTMDDGTPAPVLRQAEGPAIRLRIDGPLSRQDCVLRWQGPADVEYYKLRVTWAAEPLAEPLAEEPELTASEYRIAPEVLEHLPANARLQVHLEAVVPFGGRSLADTFYFEVE